MLGARRQGRLDSLTRELTSQGGKAMDEVDRQSPVSRQDVTTDAQVAFGNGTYFIRHQMFALVGEAAGLHHTILSISIRPINLSTVF